MLWPPFSEILPHMRRARLETAARNGILRLNGTCVIFVIKREPDKSPILFNIFMDDLLNQGMHELGIDVEVDESVGGREIGNATLRR